MKIVIDIPDEAYELLKNKTELDNIAESIIANGTPYEEKTGYWILKEVAPNVARLHCSECNGVSYTFTWNCPHCKAYMRWVEE